LRPELSSFGHGSSRSTSPGFLVVPQSLEREVAKLPVGGPLSERDLPDEPWLPERSRLTPVGHSRCDYPATARVARRV
jgi:hypothetical protein